MVYLAWVAVVAAFGTVCGIAYQYKRRDDAMEQAIKRRAAR